MRLLQASTVIPRTDEPTNIENIEVAPNSATPLPPGVAGIILIMARSTWAAKAVSIEGVVKGPLRTE